MSEKPAKTDYESTRKSNGFFGRGNPGGPGRPRGSFDYISTIRAKAEEHDVDLKEMIWEVTSALALRALEKGDAAAGKLILDRLCGPQEKNVTQLGVTVNGQGTLGAPIPEGDEVVKYIDVDLNKATKGLFKVSPRAMRKATELAADEAAARIQEAEEFDLDAMLETD